MSISGKIALAGIYEHPTRWAPDKSESLIMAECARGALDDAGLKLSDVDGLFAASMSMGIMGVANLAEYLNIKPRYLDGTNIGGSSFVAHVNHAAAAIHAGLCEVALVLYGSTAASSAMAIGTGLGGGGGDPNTAFISPYGMTTVGSYALVAQRHAHLYGTRPEQLAEIAVAMRRHASLNPEAKMQNPITVDDVLESRMISTPPHLLDCCIISDGGGALIVTSLERARDLAKPPVVLRGCGEAVCHQETGAPDLLTIAARQSGEQAFAMAGTRTSICARSTIRSPSPYWSPWKTSASANPARGGPLSKTGALAWAVPSPLIPTAEDYPPTTPECAASFSSSKPCANSGAASVRARSRAPKSPLSTEPAEPLGACTAAQPCCSRTPRAGLENP